MTPCLTAPPGTTPRVLMVTFNRLFPADQGNARRVLQLTHMYQRMGFEVDVLYHNEEGTDVALQAAMQAHFSHVLTLPSRAPKPILPGHVCPIADWYDPALGRACQHLHALRQYQVVHVNYVWYAPLLEQFGGDVLKVLDTHDVFGNRSQRYIEAGMPPRWFSTTLADENWALSLADAALAIQKEEAQVFAKRGHRNILYLPYVEPNVREFSAPASHPNASDKTSPNAKRPLRVGYIGSNNDWNILSIGQFIDALCSQRQTAAWSLVLAGGVCKHFHDRAGVMVAGFVQDLATFYDAIDIAINPMVGGTGLKIKTVEPLCYGKPILTTPHGAQGLSHLWALPIYDTPQAMLAALNQFAHDSHHPQVTQLYAQAQISRDRFEAEYREQCQRFEQWLRSKLAQTH